MHDRRFVEALGKLRGERGYLDPDTYVSAESVEVARLAAGSLIAMVDAMIDGPVAKGVALLRPPGHHARPAKAMGFCLLNNVAIAAAHARARGLERVAVVDWDVHHGNGTQEMFWTRSARALRLDAPVALLSGHRRRRRGRQRQRPGLHRERPSRRRGGDAVYASAFERVVLPVVESYAPELVLVSAGFDASARDPLAQMELSANAFGWMARELARVAASIGRGRMALVLEGGYDLVAPGSRAGKRDRRHARRPRRRNHADRRRGGPPRRAMGEEGLEPRRLSVRAPPTERSALPGGCPSKTRTRRGERKTSSPGAQGELLEAALVELGHQGRRRARRLELDAHGSAGRLHAPDAGRERSSSVEDRDSSISCGRT